MSGATDPGDETLYDRLGGEAAIAAVVDRFYERVLADERLSGAFEGVDMDRLRAHQRAFITSVTGGPADYEGADMRRAHAGLDISEAEFAAVAGHLRATLEEFDVEPGAVDEVMAVVGGLEDDVLGR